MRIEGLGILALLFEGMDLAVITPVLVLAEEGPAVVPVVLAVVFVALAVVLVVLAVVSVA